MATNYPGDIDVFREPTQPEQTALAQSGAQPGSDDTNPGRNHYQHHRDLGDAVEAIERWAAVRSHDHSGDGSDRTKGAKLSAANTHQPCASPGSLTAAHALADTDDSVLAIHHTLGTGSTQAAAGNHTHEYDGGTILHRPYVICTSTTRPSTLYPGLTIYETNTNRMWVYNNSRWNLLSAGAIPMVRLALSSNQALSSSGTTIEWNEEIEDTFGYVTPNSQGKATEIVVSEPGLYQINVGLQWSVSFVPEIATVVVCKGGVETTLRKSSVQLRSGLLSLLGINIGPEYSQTLAVSGVLRIDAGERVTVKGRYGGATPVGTIINTFFDLQSRVKSRLEMHYIGP